MYFLIEKRIDEIHELMEKEYDRLEKLSFHFTSNDMIEDEVVKIIKAYEENHLSTPKFVLLQDVYQNILDSSAFYN